MAKLRGILDSKGRREVWERNERAPSSPELTPEERRTADEIAAAEYREKMIDAYWRNRRIAEREQQMNSGKTDWYGDND